MPLTVTRAVVLHAFDYMESSRIVRLFTRDAGVQSVLARGARVSKRRFGGGAALDLFAEGDAEYQVKAGRELHTLSGFDVSRVRGALALDIGRFTAAAALAELILRFVRSDAQPELYDVFTDALDTIAVAVPASGQARVAGLAGAWRLVRELGFAPTVDRCGSCYAAIDAAAPAGFSHPAGGVVCSACARLTGASRLLPAAARETLRGWLEGNRMAQLGSAVDPAAARAHQRLLREFLREHLTDDSRPLRAFDVWEGERWEATPSG